MFMNGFTVDLFVMKVHNSIKLFSNSSLIVLTYSNVFFVVQDINSNRAFVKH